MSIEVLCPGCKTRFNVSDKFAGKKGPCPKCKAVITVPEKTEEVVVHAPQEFGPKTASGVGVLKPISRKYAKVSPVAIVGIVSGIFTVLIVAVVLRGSQPVAPWILGLGAFLLGPPLALGGYTFLRDEELEPYRGLSLMIRSLVCGAVYAGLWGAYAWLPGLAFNLEHLELFHLLVIVPPLVAVGAFAAIYSLDLEISDAVIHLALYVLVTAALGLIIGVPFMGTVPVPT
jgi:hypothetical protein